MTRKVGYLLTGFGLLIFTVFFAMTVGIPLDYINWFDETPVFYAMLYMMSIFLIGTVVLTEGIVEINWENKK